MVLPLLVGLFLKKGRCSTLPPCRLISNDTLYFVYKFELRHQGDNIEHFLSFKKQKRPLKASGPKKFEKKLQIRTKNGLLFFDLYCLLKIVLIAEFKPPDKRLLLSCC
jgi:hypothetical protein